MSVRITPLQNRIHWGIFFVVAFGIAAYVLSFAHIVEKEQTALEKKLTSYNIEDTSHE